MILVHFRAHLVFHIILFDALPLTFLLTFSLLSQTLSPLLIFLYFYISVCPDVCRDMFVYPSFLFLVLTFVFACQCLFWILFCSFLSLGAVRIRSCCPVTGDAGAPPCTICLLTSILCWRFVVWHLVYNMSANFALVIMFDIFWVVRYFVVTSVGVTCLAIFVVKHCFFTFWFLFVGIFFP